MRFFTFLFAPNSVVRFCAIITLLAYMQLGFGQVAVTVDNPTNTTPNLAASYTSLASAVSALSGITAISGPVTLTAAAGTETSPVGGYVINFTATTTATNNVVVTGTAATTITAFSPQTSASTFDAIFKIQGSDFVTIQNFNMQENSGNTVTAVATNTMTEFGVLLVHSSATEGSQNNTIQNNIISLNSTYVNSVGIFSTSSSSITNTSQDATSTAGTNSNNKIYSNTISNVAQGILFICPPITATVFETGNDIGGSSPASGNMITFGNASASSGPWNRSQTSSHGGIYLRNGAGNSIRYNSVSSNNAAYSGSTGLLGIALISGTGPTGVTFTSTISNNTVNLTNTGTTIVIGVDLGHGLSTSTNIANNNNITINQTLSTGTNSATTSGINSNYTALTNTCNNNTININQTSSGTGTITGTINCINVNGGATTINTLNNTITVNQTTSVASGIATPLNGILATSAATTLNIGSVGNGNTITFNQAVTGSGTYGGGAISYVDLGSTGHGTANVVGNTMNTTGSSIRSNGALNCVSQGSVTITALVNVKSNMVNIDRVAASGAVGFFTQTNISALDLADTLSSNNVTFTGLAGTSSATIIQKLGGTSTNTKNINNNTINVTGTNTGTVVGISSGWSGLVNAKGNTINISCSAPTVTGITSNSNTTTTVATGNSISLTSATTSPTSMTGINVVGPGGHSVSGNTFSSLSYSGIITGSPSLSAISISLGIGVTINGNIISGISAGAPTSTANPSISGIVILGGHSISVLKNKIYNLTSNCTGATGVVSGIRINGGTTTNIYNNLIGNLTASASTNSDAIRGINITSTTSSTTHNIYYNSIYISGSGGTNFGSSGIFHTTSTTASTSALNLRNNIIVNASTPNGTGLAVAYRRSSGAAGSLANYAATSNNNLFYAGTPGSSNLIYSDGTGSAQDIASYKAGVFTAGTIAPRDATSVSENVNFQSLTGSSSDFLKYDIGIPSALESGGANIATYTVDFNETVRQGNGGYTGTGTAPDIGAWELEGTGPACTTPVGGTITPATISKCASSTHSMSAVGSSIGTGISYQWEVSTTGGGIGFGNVTGGSGANTTSYTTGPLVAGTFYYRLKVTCSFSSSSNYTNEVTVIVNALPTISVSPAVTNFCTGNTSPVVLTASGASTYAWSPGTGLSAITGASVTATTTTSISYTVTGTDANACTNTAIATIAVYDLPSTVTISPPSSSICAGGIQLLTASGGGQPGIIGTGTTFLSAVANQTAFCNGRINHVAQTIYTALELTAAGFVAGNLTSLAYNISTNGDATTNANYTVKIGHVGNTVNFTSTSFLSNSGYTTVYGPSTYTHAAPGWQTITFVTPFSWDGVSNICVDVRHDGINSLNNARTQFSTTPGNASIYGYNTPSVGILSTSRLNIKFTHALVNPLTWSPTSGLYTDSGLMNAYTGGAATSVYASPISTQTYTVTATNVASCTSSASVTVTIFTSAAITTQPANVTKCAGQTANFTVVATGLGLMYQWRKNGANLTNGGNISGATTATLTISNVSAADAGTYDVAITSTCGAPIESDNKTLTVNPLPTALASSNSPICEGSTINLNMSSNAASFSWTGPNGFTSTSQNPSILTATTNMAGTYNVTVTSAFGCTLTTSTFVIVKKGLSAIAITPGSIPNNCPGLIQELASSGGNVSVGQIGTGTSVTTGNVSTSALGPNPFQTYYGGSKQQMLFTVADLYAHGLYTNAQINAVSFNLPSVTNTRILQNFRVRIQHSAASSLSSTFTNTGWTEVRTASDFGPPSVGWNIIPFTTNFTWNGMDGILVEVVYTNNDGGVSTAPFTTAVYSATSTVMTAFYRGDNLTASSIDAVTTALYTYASRNNVIFGFTANSTKIWSPIAGLYSNNTATTSYMMNEDLATVWASPVTTSSYTVTATAPNGCSSTATTTVFVQGLMVMNSNNTGLNSLRSVLSCATDGATITYNQPTVTGTTLTTPLTITKNVTILGLSDMERPEIVVPSTGIVIANNKTLTLKDVDVKSTATPTFDIAAPVMGEVPGAVSIIGTTVGKQ